MNKYKKVFITGASKGIGKALAFELAKRKSHLFLTARNTEELKTISSEISKFGVKVNFAKCDVTNQDDVRIAITQANDFLEGIDLAILNAGIDGANWFADFNIDLSRKIFDVNVFGVLNCIDYLVPIMKAQAYGSIAGVSSLADVRGMPGSGSYNASKSALSQLLAAARVELSKHNIKVINIRPGFIDTDMTAKNDFPMPFLMNSEKAAIIIANGLEKSKKVISFPFIMSSLTAILRLMPVPFYDFVMGKANYKFKK